VATPLYTPYPRLTLPWLVSAWIAAGAAVGRVRTAVAKAPSPPRLRETVASLVVGGVVCAAGLLMPTFVTPSGVARLAEAGVPGWDDRTGLRRAADAFARAARRDLLDRDEPVNRFVIGVYAEPALVLHLRRAGVPAVPLGSLESVVEDASPVPLYLAFGLHAQRDAEFDRQFQRLAGRVHTLGEIRYRPSRFVWLNHFADLPPADERTANVYLFRVE
jgi:hypothetical protein